MKDLIIFGGDFFYMGKEELIKKIADYDKMFDEIDNVFESDYKNEDGGYVHEQSFSWGFQEGVNYCLKLLKENLE